MPYFDIGQAVFVIAFLVVLTFAWGAISAAPWVPTRRREREMLLRETDFREGDKVYDLGSGDGSVLFSIACRHPGVQAVGYEVSLLPYLWSLLRRLAGGRKYRHVRLRYGDLFRGSVKDADTVFVFLLEKCYPRLVDKFRSELTDDCRVLVMAWPLPGVAPRRTVKEAGVLRMFEYRGRQFREG
ncbi:hypothetical protein AMJ57_03855 [Parcubacteria bacterium SG8_24]|nr:MAG: hypothetical protein AMJ57_03855 [Parcubacteria bacterium SG8_24]